MKRLYFTITLFVAMCFIASAQKIETFQNFENLEKGTNILTLDKGKFSSWGKSTWTVSENAGKGYDNSNKFASSGGEVNATLLQYKNLEVGATYVFSVAVKITDTDDQAWKSNYAVKVLSGTDKNKMHFYKVDDMKEPGGDKWTLHELEFTVIEGKENVGLQVYRWTPDTTLNVDNFKLIKK